MHENKFYTISACVNSTLIDNRETNHLYSLYLHWALEAFREMNFDFARMVITKEFVLNDYWAIDLPPNFVDVCKVAQRIGERFFTMGDDTTIAMLHDFDACGDVLPSTIQGDGIPNNGTNSTNYNGYWFSNFGGTSFFSFNYGGLPDTGRYRLIRSANQIQFDRSLPAGMKIYIEYISDGFDPSAGSVVNPYAYNYIKAYINYKRVCSDDNASQALKYEKGEALHYATKTARRRILGPTIQDIIDSSRTGYRMTSKV